MKPPFDLSLYFITDPEFCRARGLVETVRAAVAGGATMVQLRDPVAKTRALVEAARTLVAVLRPLRVRLIINDRADVALAADADGLHVGQADLSPADARRLIGPDRILGLSITAEADLASADLAGVDYLGVGPIFATATKPDAAPAIGTAGLRAIATRVSLPIVAIGGIHAGNAGQTIGAGARGIAVVSAIAAAVDPEAAARQLRDLVRAERIRSSADSRS